MNYFLDYFLDYHFRDHFRDHRLQCNVLKSNTHRVLSRQ